jgi:ribosomal 30S subunit maturation factor RimM
VFVVNGPFGEVLLPDIPDVVLEVDVQAGKMIVRLMPNLLP